MVFARTTVLLVFLCHCAPPAADPSPPDDAQRGGGTAGAAGSRPRPATGGASGLGGAGSGLDAGATQPRPPSGGAGGAAGTPGSDARLPTTPATVDGGIAPAGEPQPAGTGIPAASVVFDDAKLDTWTISVASAEWSKLQQTALQKMYVRATLKVGAEDVGVVGLRYKGNATLQQCFDKTGKQICPKVSLTVKFDAFEPTRRFHTLKRVNLHSLVQDPTRLHERLAYKLFRDMDIPAPRSVHARVVLNGKPHGLFALTEQVDGRFTGDRWPKFGDGNLYKQAWPLSQSATYYQDKLKTNEEVMAHGAILAFASELTTAAAPAEAAKVLDRWVGLDYLARYFAIDRAISNWDGFHSFYCSPNATTCPRPSNHNFYWYQSESGTRFWLIPWDLDQTMTVFTVFNTVPTWEQMVASCDTRFWVWNVQTGSAACDPIFRAFAAAGKPAYLKAIDDLLARGFDVARMHADIDRWAAQIAAAVQEDPYGPSVGAWQVSVARLKRDVALLRERLELARRGSAVRPFGLQIGKTDFEGAMPIEFESAASSVANGKSTIDHALNRKAPLAGTADARVDFELRNQNETQPYTQWLNFRIAFASNAVNLTALKQVRITMRADSQRTVRADLDSPKYKAAYTTGTRFGWEFTVGSSPQTFTLDASQLRIPSWAPAAGDVMSDILGTINGIVFFTSAKGVSGQGLLPNGTTDKGFLQIDDVELIMK